MPALPLPSPDRDDDVDPMSQRAALLTGTIWQDNLLQASRSLYFLVELILLGAGTSTFLATLALNDRVRSLFASLVLLSVACVGLFAARGLHDVILTRVADLHHWQRALLTGELRLPTEARSFTRFRARQRLRRGFVPHLAVVLRDGEDASDEDILQLVGAGRRFGQVLDGHIAGAVTAAWVVLVALDVTFVTLLYALGV